MNKKQAKPVKFFQAFFLLCFPALPTMIISLLMPALSKMHLYFSVSFKVAELDIWIILLGYLVGQFIYIPISKRYNPTTSLRLGLVLMLVASLLLKLGTLLTAFWLFQFGEFVIGLGFAGCFCCAFAILNLAYTQSDVKKLVPFTMFFYTFLGAAATQTSSYFSQIGLWQYNIDIIPLITLVGLVITLFIKKGPGVSAHDPHRVKASLNYKALIVYGLAMGAANYMSYGYSIAMPVLVTHVLDVSLTTYGTYTLILAPLMIPAFFLSFYSLKYLGARKSSIISIAVTLVLIIILYALRFVPAHIVIPLFLARGLLNVSTAVLFPAAVFLASNSSKNKQYAASLAGFINVGSILAALLLQDILPMSSFNNFLLVVFVFFSIVFVLSLIEGKGSHSVN